MLLLDALRLNQLVDFVFNPRRFMVDFGRFDNFAYQTPVLAGGGDGVCLVEILSQ